MLHGLSGTVLVRYICTTSILYTQYMVSFSILVEGFVWVLRCLVDKIWGRIWGFGMISVEGGQLKPL